MNQGGGGSGGRGGGGVGGSGGGGGSGGASADLAVAPSDGGTGDVVDMSSACINKTTPLTDGHHNAGAACLDCHGGGGPTLFTFAGTLFSASSGGSAVAGATVEAVDAKGQVVRIITSSNGNFYTSTPVTFPLTVRATACPSNLPMSSQVQDGNCNSGNCHGSQMQVHVP